jgi:hypothetical protein
MSHVLPKFKDVEELFEVERILAVRQGRRSTEYLVQWKNYSLDESSWEEEWRLQDSIPAVEEFLHRVAAFHIKLEDEPSVKQEVKLEHEVIDLTDD